MVVAEAFGDRTRPVIAVVHLLCSVVCRTVFRGHSRVARVFVDFDTDDRFCGLSFLSRTTGRPGRAGRLLTQRNVENHLDLDSQVSFNTPGYFQHSFDPANRP